MLVGGPKLLQEQMFPGGVSQNEINQIIIPPRLTFLQMLQTPAPTSVMLPSQFHPDLIGCLVSFLYTSDYNAPSQKQGIWSRGGKPELLSILEGPSPMFHMQMYALAEYTEYEALKTAVRSKLWDLLMTYPHTDTFASTSVKDCVNAVFSPRESLSRILGDSDGAMQQLIIAVVIVREIKERYSGYMAGFLRLLKEPVRTFFSQAYNNVKFQNAAIIDEFTNERLQLLGNIRARRIGKLGMDTTAAHDDAARPIMKYEPPATRAHIRNSSTMDLDLKMQRLKLRRENKLKTRAGVITQCQAPVPALHKDGSHSLDTGTGQQNTLPQVQMPLSVHSIGFTDGVEGMKQGHHRRLNNESYGGCNSAERGVVSQDIDTEMQEDMTRMKIDDGVEG